MVVVVVVVVDVAYVSIQRCHYQIAHRCRWRYISLCCSISVVVRQVDVAAIHGSTGAFHILVCVCDRWCRIQVQIIIKRHLYIWGGGVVFIKYNRIV